jgi:hypothetical protein
MKNQHVLYFTFAVCWAALSASAQDKPSFQLRVSEDATATVQAIELEKRLVTLKSSEGRVETIQVSEAARNLPQVKVGDLVSVTCEKTLDVQVVAEGAAVPGESSAEVTARAPKGEKPAGAVMGVQRIAATIAGIDKIAGTATLEGSDGVLRPVRVLNPENLDRIAVGDRVLITYTEISAVSVTEPPPAPAE